MKSPENELITLDEEYRLGKIIKDMGLSLTFMLITIFLIIFNYSNYLLETGTVVFFFIATPLIYLPFFVRIFSKLSTSKKTWKKRLELEKEGTFIEGTVKKVIHTSYKDSGESPYDSLLVKYTDGDYTKCWTSPPYSPQYNLETLCLNANKCILLKGEDSLFLHRLQDIDLQKESKPVPSHEENSDEFFLTSGESISLLPKDYALTKQSDFTPAISVNTLPSKPGKPVKTRYKWWLIPSSLVLSTRFAGFIIESLIYSIGNEFLDSVLGKFLVIFAILLFLFDTCWTTVCAFYGENKKKSITQSKKALSDYSKSVKTNKKEKTNQNRKRKK